MEIILDILFDLIIEGSMGAVGDKRVPMPLRIAAAAVLILFFGGIVTVLVFIGIKDQNWIIAAVGVLIAVIVVAAVLKTMRRHRR